MSSLLALMLYVVFAVATVGIMAATPLILAPWRPGVKKKAPFECGQTPFPWIEQAFQYEYFPYLIIYVAYAVVGIVVFISSMILVDAPHLADRILVLFGSLAVGALFIGLRLKTLKQKLVVGRSE